LLNRFEPEAQKAVDRQGLAKRARITDVARAAGVSKTTVSFAFNSPERLSSETADRILAIARDLGYRPHPVARMLTVQRTSTLGILTPQSLSQIFANPFFPLFAEGVGAVGEERGYGLLIISPLHGSLAGALARASVDGVVALGLEETHPDVEWVRQAGIPLVLVDAVAWPEHGAVEIDDEGGARAAADHVAALGHRDVLLICIEPQSPAARAADVESIMNRRLRGWRAGLEAAGVPADDAHVLAGPATFEGGETAMLRAWEDGLRPSAVLAMSDAMAIGVLQAARHLRLRVPGDLSVAGFDDLPISRFTDPPLTTVHQPVREKGEAAARLLLAMIGEPGRSPEHLRFEARLVVRQSTAPLSQGDTGPGEVGRHD
jgi:alanine racemase